MINVKLKVHYLITKNGPNLSSTWHIEDLIPLLSVIRNLFFNECAIRNDMAIAFDPEGYAYKCWEVIGNKEYAIGKLNDDGILTDINQTVLNRQLYGADTFDDPACSKCKYLPICNGGCPIQRIENKFEAAIMIVVLTIKALLPIS